MGSARTTRQQAIQDLQLEGCSVDPRVALRAHELMAGVWRYVRITRRYRRSGLQSALEALDAISDLAGDRPVRAQTTVTTVHHARDAAWRLRGLARTIIGRHECLEESLGICAALRPAGFPVQIVIGYPLIEPPDGSEELHAWPAIGEQSLTGRVAGNTSAFVELRRYPIADDDVHNRIGAVGCQ